MEIIYETVSYIYYGYCWENLGFVLPPQFEVG